jgi:CheY-like chemotaxis protein
VGCFSKCSPVDGTTPAGKNPDFGTSSWQFTHEATSSARLPESRILVVEDEERVRVMVESILIDIGHQTLSAATIAQAFAVIQTDQPIDLLFTDIGLAPDVAAGLVHPGLELAQQAVELRPDLRVLYTSGKGVGWNESHVCPRLRVPSESLRHDSIGDEDRRNNLQTNLGHRLPQLRHGPGSERFKDFWRD